MRGELAALPHPERVSVERRDYFGTDWNDVLDERHGYVLVVGNFPWVTNAAQGAAGAKNLPPKSNYLKLSGIEAMTGRSNFDISEWMLLDVMGWLRDRDSTLAMLCKSAVARKTIAHARRLNAPLVDASIARIDALRHFSASVDACLLTMHFSPGASRYSYDYGMYESLEAAACTRMGERMGLAVSDIPSFEANARVVGASPVRWRSGVKHDAVGVMELVDAPDGRQNLRGEPAEIEDTYVYPMLKGADVYGGPRNRMRRWAIVPQRYAGEPTAGIERDAPRTWAYLMRHGADLARRKSAIYKNGPPFAVFGVGDYTFMPWKIAVSALHKSWQFRLVGPVDGKPVVFDDTVYFMGFSSKREAERAYGQVTSAPVLACLRSLTFWDEKRPIKAHVLNRVDWSAVTAPVSKRPAKARVRRG